MFAIVVPHVKVLCVCVCECVRVPEICAGQSQTRTLLQTAGESDATQCSDCRESQQENHVDTVKLKGFHKHVCIFKKTKPFG